MSRFDSQQTGTDDAYPVGDAVTLPPEVYEQIVRRVQELCESSASPVDGDPSRCSRDADQAPPDVPHGDSAPQPLAPQRPCSLAETGLSLGELSALILKATYLHGSLTGFEIASQLRIPFLSRTKRCDFLPTNCASKSSRATRSVDSRIDFD